MGSDDERETIGDMVSRLLRKQQEHRTDLKIRSRRHFYAFARSFPLVLLLGPRSGDRGWRGSRKKVVAPDGPSL